MGKKAQKRGGRAPRRPTPPPPPPEDPTSSDEEYMAMDQRALVARCKALEAEKREREAGNGDGGSTSAASLSPRTFTRKGRGSLMFQRQLSHNVNKRAAQVERPSDPSQPEPMPKRKAANTSLAEEREVGSGEDIVDDFNNVYECWDERDGFPLPSKQMAPQFPWWFPGWGGPYFPWTSINMNPMDNPWANLGQFSKSRGFQKEQDAMRSAQPFLPFCGDLSRSANFSWEDSGINERPYGSVDLPLGGHLALTVKEKIWRGEFVDLFSLLHTEPEPVPKVGEPERDQETVKKRKIDRNWTNWLYGYCIYMAVVVQLHPKKAPALIKYLDIVHRTMRDFGGQAWLQYDQNFRLRASHDPSLSWSVPQFELWMQVVTPARPIMGDRSDSGHLIARNVVTNPKASSGAQGVQAQRSCFEFNSSGACSKAGCLFSHQCAMCGGKHPVSSCPKGRWTRAGSGRFGKKPGGGQPPTAPGKGPLPS